MLKAGDVKEGKLSFGQKIELVKIALSTIADCEKAKEMIRCLGGKINKITPFNVGWVAKYITEVNEGLVYWAELEAKCLKYEPTMEERKSGYMEISKKFGDFATIEALANKYKKDPDDILKWEYGKVFTILWKDLEEHKITMRNYEREKLKK
jgi:hypothetical protein